MAAVKKGAPKRQQQKRKMAPKPKGRKRQPQGRKGRTVGTREVPASRGTIFENNTGNRTLDCKGAGQMLSVKVPSGTTAGTVLAVIELSPQLWQLLNMGKAAQTYQRFRFKRFKYRIVSAAPSNVTGMLGFAYLNDPDVQLPKGDPTALVSMLSSVPGFQMVPLMGEWQREGTARFPPGKDQDFLYTDSQDDGAGQTRFTTQGKLVLVVTSDVSTYTGNISLSIMGEWDIDFKQPRTQGAGQVTDGFLPGGEYQCAATGEVRNGDGTPLDASVLAPLDSAAGVYYVLAPSLPLGSSGGLFPFAFCRVSDGALCPTTTANNAINKVASVGAAIVAECTDTTLVGRNALASSRQPDKRNEEMCLKAMYGPVWKRIAELRIGERKGESEPRQCKCSCLTTPQ